MRSLGTAVIELDNVLIVRYVNPAAETLIGLSERQVVGQELGDILRPSEALTDICHRALDTGLTFGIREFATRAATKQIVVDCRAGPIENGEGLLVELNDTMFDRRMRHDADLIAQQKLSRRILRQLAHEVKNPLGGIRGAAQLLERKVDDPDLEAYTKVIIAEVDRLAALVDSILGSGGQPKAALINLHEVTEHVANLIDAEKPAEVAVVRDYDPSLPRLAVDKNQMIQALLNVARNALQAVGEQGRITLRTRAISNVAIGGRLHRLALTIEVEDDGPGIPEDLQETVFYPLVSGRSDGTGIGLTMAQDLVSRNGGLIEFQSEPGRTVFQLRLPVSHENPGDGRNGG